MDGKSEIADRPKVGGAVRFRMVAMVTSPTTADCRVWCGMVACGVVSCKVVWRGFSCSAVAAVLVIVIVSSPCCSIILNVMAHVIANLSLRSGVMAAV